MSGNLRAPILDTYIRVWGLLSRRERYQAVLLLFLIVVMGFTQMAGVSSVMPFISLAANPAAIETNSFLRRIYTLLGFGDVQQYLLFLGVVTLSALVVSIAIKALTAYTLTRFIEMRSYSLSRKLMASYLHQPYDWFLNRHSADLGKTVLSESEYVIIGALQPALYLISEGVVVVTLFALLIVVDPTLAVSATVVFAGSYAVIYLVLRNYLERIGAERLSANRERFESVQETFGSIKDVKVSGLEGALLKRFDHPARRFALARAAEVVAHQMPRFAIEALAFSCLLVVVFYLLAKPGGLQHALPVLAAYAFAAYRLMPALQNFYAMLVALRFSGPALEALNRELIALAPEVDGLPEERSHPLRLRTCLKLERLTYAYPGSERPAIDGLSLEILANTTVGLVGKTGSGKTTAVDIILGLLRPQQGCLRVDGATITKNNLRAWQASIGYVPQHIYLADVSITSNIALGVPPEHVDHQAVERAAGIANIHEFVTQELPRGYETTVGERGVRLSGGQRQRIGIARALYHDPDLLVLDEATSALDSLTEQAVMEALHNLGRRKTVIIIAHRLSTVRDCDKIVLLANGKIVAQGQFDDLADREDAFRAMIMAAAT
jgi:ABC-type multidrug transport system fused ATPase/permease subunit